jgi:catechol-2,3-dioxygenase
VALGRWSIDQPNPEDPMATARLPEPAPPHLRPSRFSHLVLKTARFDAMTAWYKTVLSARPMFENEAVCFLTYDEEHHRVMIGRDPNATPRDPRAAGVVHFAYAVETLADLVNAYERLEAQGIVPHHCINHGFTTSLYYLDPDGNEVELQVDNYKDRDAMNAWFATGAFDGNFVGVRFDPERMVELHRQGVAEDRILQKELYG